MEFEGVKFKYENDCLYRQSMTSNQYGKKGDWINYNNVKPHPNGYKIVTIKKKRYLVHRLVYKLHNPDWNIYDTSSDNQIDHINMDKSNNKIENLRVVNNSLNNLNNKAKGYYYHKKAGKYHTRIMINNKTISLGYYDTEEQAKQVYEDYKKNNVNFSI
jgi:hypothetical protein